MLDDRGFTLLDRPVERHPRQSIKQEKKESKNSKDACQNPQHAPSVRPSVFWKTHIRHITSLYWDPSTTQLFCSTLNDLRCLFDLHSLRMYGEISLFHRLRFSL
jgi:hypothetical protein